MSSLSRSCNIELWALWTCRYSTICQRRFSIKPSERFCISEIILNQNLFFFFTLNPRWNVQISQIILIIFFSNSNYYWLIQIDRPLKFMPEQYPERWAFFSQSNNNQSYKIEWKLIVNRTSRGFAILWTWPRVIIKVLCETNRYRFERN